MTPHSTALCRLGRRSSLLALPLCFVLALSAHAAGASQPLITTTIDEHTLVALPGNVRPEATEANDRGAVPDSMPFDHMLLELQRSPAVESALEAYMQSTQTQGSPNYHQWLTAAELAAQYGPAPADVSTITAWLQSHGFQVNGVSGSGMFIDFSGTAAQVTETFKTEIHSLEVNGQSHFANMQNPRIPAALAPVVTGLVALHDFRPHPAITPVTTPAAKPAGVVKPVYTINSVYQLVVPADLATIYNFNPVFQSGTTGRNQTVVLLERTDLFNNQDYFTFRKTFGLDNYKDSTFTVEHPGGCTDPGVRIGDDGEAAVDVEWSAAAAPDAKIVLASCADTATNFGPLIALQALIDSRTPPAIVSLSYGGCEAAQGSSGNQQIKLLYQQAAAEGTSIYVAAGDAGAAMCDDGAPAASYGISVNGLASTPYNLAAGGTDFTDALSGTNAEYWNATNSPVYGSAKSYIPEMPWDDSCANVPFANYVGYPTTYGVNGFCNSPIGEEYLDVIAGGGGPSACAYGNTSPDPNTPATSGTCKGYAKPIWQYGLAGVPNDGVRDLPDVSLFASNGFWGHYYVICYSDPAGGGGPCSGPPDTWAGAGGTSFVAPILAGVQALVNQTHYSISQGNPDYVYYDLASRDYGFFGNPACDSSRGNGSCIFHDVTYGDNDVNCIGTFNCYDPSGPNGVLSVSDKYYLPAYRTNVGWDFSSGIGTLNVQRLVSAWSQIP